MSDEKEDSCVGCMVYSCEACPVRRRERDRRRQRDDREEGSDE